MHSFKRVCAYINKDAITHNILQIKNSLPHHVKIMPVIKADGYGHGALCMAEETMKFADYFAVAVIEEAILLRKKGINKPILLLGHTASEFYDDAIQNNITVTIFSFEDAKKLSIRAKKANKTAKIHIAIDTGMGRIGFLPDEESADVIKEISMLDFIEFEGVFTHFATSDEADKSFTNLQAEKFCKFRQMLEKRKIEISLYHASNSAAVMEYKDFAFDMVRPGIILYGLYPSDDVDKKVLDLHPVMELRTHVAFVKNVKEGDSIGYGRTYIAKQERKIATIPVGYADGYPRLLSNKGRVIINGKYAPIVGRVCMDQFMVDVSHIDNVSVGDEVILIGKQGDCLVSADEIAQLTGTINYEIVCGISKRVPREVI